MNERVRLLSALKIGVGLGAFLAGCAFGAATAHADVEAVFIPSGPATEGLPAALAALPGVKSAAAVFDRGEQAFLVSQDKAGIAASVKLTLSDSDALEALKRRKGLPGRFELNPRVRLHAANSEQWGLNNTGKPQEVVISDILSRFIKSVPGEDAGVLHAPAEIPGRKTLVAVIDTGVELTHPALASQVHRTQSECDALAAFNQCMATQVDKKLCHDQYDNLDTDGNGYPLDCSGWDMTGDKSARTGLAGSGDVSDMVGHGTHVSGIIAGSGFISGVASQVEILPVKVLGSASGTSSSADGEGGVPDPHGPDFTQDSTVADVVARGVLYAIRSHAQVLNLSLGYSIHDDSELMRQMVALAESRGILVVAAAGNESSRTPVYPCRYPGVVCVASFSADGSVSHFSDFGDAVDIAAPGYGILSAWPTAFYPSLFTERKGYDFKSGTSMASPFVAGVLARLLNHGFSPEEAYARMMLGARPSLPPTAMAELEPKFTLTGNVDLARAFAVRPQPLILPELKESVLVPLDRQKAADPRSAPFKLSLKNLWRDGAHVNVSVAISSDSQASKTRLEFGSDGATLSRSFDRWRDGETRTLEGTLSWSAPIADLAGEFYLEVTVSGAGMDTRSFKKSVEFVVPVRPMALVTPQGPEAGDAKISRISTDLTAQSLPENYAIKPISCVPQASGLADDAEDLLLILRSGNSTILQLLAMTGEGGGRSLKKSGGDLIDNTKEQLFAFSCLDLARDGKRDYVVTTVNAADKKFTFTYFDSLFRHGRDALKLEFSSDTVAMPDDFRWISGINADRTLAPVFIARGKMPASELPGFNPWERRPEDVTNPADQRLYYVTQDGLHTLKAPDGYHYLGLLKPTRTELAQGTASVVLFKGTDYVLDYYVAPLTGLTLGVPEKLDFSIYQRLNGLKSYALMSNGVGGDVVGTVFAEEGTAGRMRLSVEPAHGASTQPEPLLPWVLEPLKAGDTLSQVIASFGDSAEGAQAFTRSRFQLYFHDRKTNTTLGTDLKQYDASTRHLPAWVEGEPAMLMPEGQGSSLTTELIVPRLLDGRAALVRPASLKTFGAEGCELIQLNATGLGGAGGALSEGVRRLIYFCGDHFVEIAL